jgi:spore maturation protein CgeB
MKLVFFVHSLVSDWNHGNAHFLRGVVRELLARGHDVRVYEPEDAWSRDNLVRSHSERPLRDFERAFPELTSHVYGRRLDVTAAVDGADAVLVHEWNEPWLVRAVGRTGVPALFHDTHHRAVTAPGEMRGYDLSGYAGVLAFGRAVAEVYRDRSWHDRAWVWHEAADTRLFRPLRRAKNGSVVWIGNWGDDERTRELRTFLFVPVRRLGLSGAVYGVRYPSAAQRVISRAGLRYGGWLANFHVPDVFARYHVTMHIPRRPYASALPGVPTIRVFEALACGIPLVSAPWDDVEGLFAPGDDFLVARTGREMESHLREVLADRDLARRLARHGRRTILARHTCAHRVDELLAILRELGIRVLKAVPAAGEAAA